MKEKKRLDKLVFEQHPDLSRTYIQSIIMQGKVLVNGQSCVKPGTMLASDAELTITAKEPKYVSRAGLKLERALDHFDINVNGLVALDSGISTGGFSDCLLQRGAKRVYGVDVGYGQVHEKVSSNPRLTLMERTNLRHLERLPELVDLVTLDLSFISILKVMPAVSRLIKPDGKIILLIKPQFEAERHEIGRGGIVKSELVHERVIEKIRLGMEEFGFVMDGIVDSPITGAKGNKEFLALFLHNGFVSK
ncbi:TlyA family RNA methyltransferase [Candidatus Dependentiae bacterium]|nr:TlyA family RNA methyltransferase [Candidatus Dependentiae bacterium]